MSTLNTANTPPAADAPKKPKAAKAPKSKPVEGSVAEEPKAPKPTKLKFEKKTVRLDELTFSAKHQARESLNKEALADYTEQAKAAKTQGADSPFPPLKAIKRGEFTFVFSGFTRGAALKKADYESTVVEVAESENISDSEIFRLAVEANLTHGARLTNEDKQHNLARALKYPEFACLSNVALADIVGASAFFIGTHRPAGLSPENRVSKKGVVIKTGGIGKKGGAAKKPSKKAEKAAANLAANKGGSADKPNLDGDEDDKSEGKSSGMSDKSSQALRRIASILDGKKGFVGSEIRKGVETGSIKLTEADLVDFAGSSDARIVRVAGLVLNEGWKPKKAYAHIDKPVTVNTKLVDLITSAITTDGVSKMNGVEIGESIDDQPTFRVVVYDKTKYAIKLEKLTPEK